MKLRCGLWLFLFGVCLSAHAQTNGVVGIYYKGRNFEEAILKRYDQTINFVWDSDSPAQGVPDTDFSVRWSGQVLPTKTEEYTFYTETDDGVRLWINGKKIINNWTDHGPTEDKGVIKLVAGQHCNLVMEFYQGGGGAMARLSWSSPSTAKSIVPKERLYPRVFPSPEKK